MVVSLPSLMSGDGHCVLWNQILRELSSVNLQYYSVKYEN